MGLRRRRRAPPLLHPPKKNSNGTLWYMGVPAILLMQLA